MTFRDATRRMRSKLRSGDIAMTPDSGEARRVFGSGLESGDFHQARS